MNSVQRVAPARLLMTADAIGGIWTYAIELSRALARHGVEIRLATMGTRLTPEQQAQVDSLPNVEVFESTFKLEWMDEPRADVERAGNWLLELEDDFRPDLVHLNSFSHGAFPWRSPKVIVGHSCVLSWWRAVHGCNAPEEWDEYSDMVMAGLHGAEMVIAPSHAMLAALAEHYGPFRASTVIPHGRALSLLRSRRKENLILTSGQSSDEANNISALVRIAPRLPWPVYIAGDQGNLTGRLALSNRINYLGNLSPDEMIRWYQSAPIFALAARYEPFGISILEAALAGCALVLGDIPSLREIWGDAALFVSPDDPAALEHGLKELIADPTETARLAAKARTAAARYTPEKMVDGYLAAFALVMGERASRTPLPDLANAAVH
jgi:glycogen synthase